MKTLTELRKEYKYAMVYTHKDFMDMVRCGGFNSDDGIGYYHDGEKETNVSVWEKHRPEEVTNFPYVCWYNK